MITNALPTTSFSGMVPSYPYATWQRESHESDRWSPSTNSRPGGTTTLQGVSQKSAAKSDQTYAQVLGATGGILLVTGVVLFFTAGPAEAKTPQKGTIKVLPNVGRDQTGLSLVGTF